MLGERICDPSGVESGGEIRGLGLLPMETVFEQEKTRTRISGTFLETGGILRALSGQPFEGYEIHMGTSAWKEGAVPLIQVDEKAAGTCHGNIYGSYVHGIFDRSEAAGALVQAVGNAKGISTEDMKSVDFQAFKETQYDLLADGLRKSMDMEKIYQILNDGILT